MALVVNGILFDELTADPGSPADGETWFNTTDSRFRIRVNGSTKNIVFLSELTTHTGDTTNPHTVTLEQARTANNTVAGEIAMGSSKITGLASPTVAGDAAEFQWVLDQIRIKIQGLDWQDSVLDQDLYAPPGVPSTGDRYLIAEDSHAITAVDTVSDWFKVSGDITTNLLATDTFTVSGSTGNDGTYTVASTSFAGGETQINVNETVTDATVDGTVFYAEGDWNNHGDELTEWNGTAWEIISVNEGAVVRVEDENIYRAYDGTSWGAFGINLDHGNLTGKGDDDHTQYLLVDGTRAMTGSLNMGTFNITNVGTVDGVTVSDHKARHIRAGADEIDGDKLDIDFTPSNYTPSTAPAEVTHEDELSAHLAGIDDALDDIGGSLRHKAGRVLAAGFAGNPRTATVSFSTAYADTNYEVTLTAYTTNNKSFAPATMTKTAGGFTIMLGSNNTNDLTYVSWIAMKTGESA